MGGEGCQWEWEVAAGDRRCQVLYSLVLSWEGEMGLRRPYGDSLHWAKFEDKELLISNKAEYLSV